MSDIDRTRMIPLHIADQAVAACDAEIAKLREDYARLKAEVERLEKLVGKLCFEKDQSYELRQNAEATRLKAEVERLTDKIRVSDNHAQCLEFVINSGTANELRLQAQVERLTKAGDCLYKSMMEIGCNEMADNFQYDAWFGSMKEWKATKEPQP